jgi:hypothetical protein
MSPSSIQVSGKPQHDMTLLVRGHDIVAVGRARQVKIPTSAKVMDGTGKFVIPGLWDMHSHFRDAGRDLKMDIANGVLGMRNMGGAAKDVFPLRDAIAHGQQLGPRIVACRPIIDGPDSWSNPQFTISLATADETRAAVVSLKQQGTDCIKVYDGLSRESYFTILDEAKKLDLPVVGTSPAQLVFVKRQMLASGLWSTVFRWQADQRWRAITSNGVWINLPFRRPSLQRTSD